MPISWAGFIETVAASRRFLLTSHVRPDCDALGSELGLAHILESLGKDVLIVNADATPPNLAFIDPDHRIRQLGREIQAAELESREVILVLDTSAWLQLGAMGQLLRALPGRRIVIDHHVSEDDLGATSFKDPTAEATGRLVVEAADQLGAALTPAAAAPLFAALATDTGWFRFPSTSGRTYELAARLVDAGADPARIYAQLYEQDTLGRVKLRGVILSRVVSECQGRLVHTYVRRADFEATGSVPSDTEDVINMTLQIAGAQFAVICVELAGGTAVKISFRSRCALDCSAIAAEFGGGGHRAAAGATVPGPLETAQSRVLDRVRQLLA